MERPELREFKGNPVNTVLDNRGAYIRACLIIVRAYFLAGRPDKATPLASFEGWSNVVRSALIWLGQPDPVESMAVAQEANPERVELLEMMEAWGEVIGFGERHKET
jgi:putative DNA primase/helicase